MLVVSAHRREGELCGLLDHWPAATSKKGGGEKERGREREEGRKERK